MCRETSATRERKIRADLTLLGRENLHESKAGEELGFEMIVHAEEKCKMPVRVSEIIKGELYLTDMTAAISQETKQSIKVKYLNIDLEDNMEVDLTPAFEKASAFANGAINGEDSQYLHALYNRVISYLVKFKEMSLKDAFNLVKDKRSQIAPNPQFSEQLIKWARGVREGASEGITSEEMCGGAVNYKKKAAKGAAARSALDGLAGSDDTSSGMCVLL